MKTHEISDGQGSLLTPELTVPDEVKAAPGREVLEDRKLDHAVDTQGISYALARGSLDQTGLGHEYFKQVTNEIRSRAEKGEYKKQLPPPDEWRGSAS